MIWPMVFQSIVASSLRQSTQFMFKISFEIHHELTVREHGHLRRNSMVFAKSPIHRNLRTSVEWFDADIFSNVLLQKL